MGDGFGDFRGLTQKLDYLQDLGVTAIWLLPFYPSPLRDDGYDIADYTGIHPDFGNLESFREFLDAAHARGLRQDTVRGVGQPGTANRRAASRSSVSGRTRPAVGRRLGYDGCLVTGDPQARMGASPIAGHQFTFILRSPGMLVDKPRPAARGT